jgi:predicted ATPase
MDRVPGTVRCPLLIGRDDLLELADRRLDDVEAGRGQLLLVAGEAGIGKTRFLDAISQKAGERRFVAAWGYVAPQDYEVPAASILDLARSMLRVPSFAELGRELLSLREQTVEADDVRYGRRLAMDVVDKILAALDGPTLLGFEDLQWADDLSLGIIAELARRSRDRDLLICGGYRTDEGPPGTSLRDWRSRLLTQRIAEEVRLVPLSRAETALVTTLILDTGLPAPREVVDAVYERTDGIPLHIEELLGALNAEARASGLAIREATVPDTIEDAVLARLSHRSPEAQAVAKAGAIIGRCFNAEVLAGIMDVPTESIDAPLQELIDQSVLDPPGARGVFDFRHQLLRDAIYRSVPVADRRRFHARAGDRGQVARP